MSNRTAVEAVSPKTAGKKVSLNPAQVDGREGFVASGGLVFATPTKAKKLGAWKARLRKAGYRFHDDAEEVA